MGGDAGRWLALGVGIEGDVATIRLRRPQRANALNEATITELGEFFAEPPAGVRAAVLLAEGEHFCAGLDLAEHRSRSPFESMEHSRRWHATFDRLEHGRVPVVAALQGACAGRARAGCGSIRVLLSARGPARHLRRGRRRGPDRPVARDRSHAGDDAHRPASHRGARSAPRDLSRDGPHGRGWSAGP
jgi:hypothetical protein